MSMVTLLDHQEWNNLIHYATWKTLYCKKCNHMVYKTREKVRYDSDFELFVLGIPEILSSAINPGLKFCEYCSSFLGCAINNELKIQRKKTRLELSNKNEYKIMVVE